LSGAERDALWDEAGRDNRAKAWQATVSLARAPGGPAYLLGRLEKQSTADEAKRIEKLIVDLDSDEFSVREKATEELEAIGPGVESAVKKALQKDPPFDMRRRLERVLERIDTHLPTPEALRPVRVVEALEVLGTTEARRTLEALVKGSSSAAAEAKAALERMSR
jgi:hypothetical protein